MIKVFIGYDSQETTAFSVLAYSIHARASQPVQIAPVMLSQLKSLYTRPTHPLQSTDFSFSRFLVPHLCGYDDFAIFMDCDMVMLDDVAKLWALRDDRYAVQVVRHKHVPKESVKFLEHAQTKYEKKNWSSVMLFNNRRCTALTPDYVNAAAGLELHQFKWLGDDGLIGELPKRWNHLVDYDPAEPVANLSLLHYTTGGPYFEAYRSCGYADIWFAERDRMLAVSADRKKTG